MFISFFVYMRFFPYDMVVIREIFLKCKWLDYFLFFRDSKISYPKRFR